MPGRLLKVTSPYMHGKDVLFLQENLNLSVLLPNEYRIRVDEDSQYGPMTSHAVARAHYWCGYLGISLNADPELAHYLHQDLSLPAVDRVRRAYRLAHRPADPLNLKARKLALSLKDRYGSIIWDWTFRQEAWCVDTVSYVYAHVGSKAFNRTHYCGCDALIAAAHLHVNGLTLIKTPVPGCIGIADWGMNGSPNHAVIVIDPATGVTIQGNHDPYYIREVNMKAEGTWGNLRWFILPTK